VVSEALLEEEEPQAAISDPALNAKPPLAVFFNTVRREIKLMTAARFRILESVGTAMRIRLGRSDHRLLSPPGRDQLARRALASDPVVPIFSTRQR
jgi:hypothetical protein